MKKILIVAGCATLCLLASAWVYQDRSNVRPTYAPILMDRAALQTSIEVQASRELENPGKIYFKDNYIFISDRYQGIHIIDNQDPKSPVNMGFIRIPGTIDMAVKGSILYADNAVDLVAIELADFPNSIAVSRRIENAFPELTPPDGSWLPFEYQAGNRPENTIIVGWQHKKITP